MWCSRAQMNTVMKLYIYIYIYMYIYLLKIHIFTQLYKISILCRMQVQRWMWKLVFAFVSIFTSLHRPPKEEASNQIVMHVTQQTKVVDRSHRLRTTAEKTTSCGPLRSSCHDWMRWRQLLFKRHRRAHVDCLVVRGPANHGDTDALQPAAAIAQRAAARSEHITSMQHISSASLTGGSCVCKM